MNILNGDHAQFEIDNANTPIEHRSDWPLPSFDAKDWAKEFCRIARIKGLDIDEGWMIGWFANALMRGFDEGVSRVLRPGDFLAQFSDTGTAGKNDRP